MAVNIKNLVERVMKKQRMGEFSVICFVPQ